VPLGFFGEAVNLVGYVDVHERHVVQPGRVAAASRDEIAAEESADVRFGINDPEIGGALVAGDDRTGTRGWGRIGSYDDGRVYGFCGRFPACGEEEQGDCRSAEYDRLYKLLYEGKAFDGSLLPRMLEGVPAAALGRDVRYGLGVILTPTDLGPAWGHSGFFPGYLTEMRYYPEHGFALALQFNTSVGRAIGRNPGTLLHGFAQTVAAALAGG